MNITTRPVPKPAFVSSLIFALAVMVCLAAMPTPLAAEARAQAEGRPAAPPQQPNSQEDGPGFAISVTVPVVNVDVVVTDNQGNYLTGLKKENFRILEDGKPQVVSNFTTTDAPIRVVLLLEYSKLGGGWFLYNAVNWADVFLRQLQPHDWVALASYSMRPNIEVDFTNNPLEIRQALSNMYFPSFSEANLYDAVLDTLDRLEGVSGRTAILLLASGLDTFSRSHLDDVLKRLKETDVVIHSVGVGEELFTWREPFLSGASRLNYLQAQNQLRSFAEITGGRSWFPRFQGQIPAIMADVAASLRHQYSLAYSPTNTATDGKFRRIKVELVDEKGAPLNVVDERGKKVNYKVYARQGYTAPTSNVAD